MILVVIGQQEQVMMLKNNAITWKDVNIIVMMLQEKNGAMRNQSTMILAMTLLLEKVILMRINAGIWKDVPMISIISGVT
jgi:hypothetical protein